MALGQMYMKEMEFWEMRLGTFFLKLHFFIEGRELQYRREAELVRAQTYTLLNIQLRIQDRYRNVHDMWPFPWDTEQQNKKLTEEEKKAQAKRIKQMFKLLEKQ